MTKTSFIRRAVIVTGPAVLLLITMGVSLYLPSYRQYVMSLVLIGAVVGGALVLPIGYARMITLASGAMMAIGAYTSMLLVAKLDVPYLPAVLLGGVFSGIGGAILALPATRLRGHYFALVTLVFQAVTIIIIREWRSLTGGAIGLVVPPVDVLGHDLVTDDDYLVFIGIVGALLLLILGVVVNGWYGRNLSASTVSETAANAFGIDRRRYCVAAFAISSATIGIAGGLLAPRVFILDPRSFDVVQSILLLAGPIVGGMTSLAGGAIGGGLMRALPEFLRPVAEYQALVYAIIVLVIIILAPDGLVGLSKRLLRRISRIDRRGATMAPDSQPGTGGSRDANDPREVRESHLADDATNAIAIENLQQHYDGVQALRGVDLAVPAGIIQGIIGPNGAGKTTLFNVVSGFVMPSAGGIRIFDQDLAPGRPRRLIQLGATRTFQHVAVFGTLTCLENVMIGVGNNSLAQSLKRSALDAIGRRDARLTTAMEALEAVGIGHLAQRPASALALGEQRRLEIARAIVSAPRLVLLDEPESGLHADEIDDLRALLRALNRARGLTLVLVSHNIRFVLDVCDSLAVMIEGRVMLQGVPSEVIAHPEVRHAYFGERQPV